MFTVLHKYDDGAETLIGNVSEVTKIKSPNRASGDCTEWDVMLCKDGVAILIPIVGRSATSTEIDPCLIVMNEQGRTVAKFDL